MEKINAGDAKFITLARNDKLKGISFSTGTLRINYPQVGNEIGDNIDAIKSVYLDLDVRPGVASNHARQVYTFFTAPEDTVWFTFVNGLLHWCKAKSGVTSSGILHKGAEHGFDGEDGDHYRETFDGWHYTDIFGKELQWSGLDESLASIKGYRGTIRNIPDDAFASLLVAINGER